jgi:hypothetical protein
MKKQKTLPQARLCETCFHYIGNQACFAFDRIPMKYWKQDFEEAPLHTRVDKNQYGDSVYKFNGFYLE